MDANTQPLVSVVTPVYDGEKYLAECIESVLTQTHQNWEYIIVNNCSKDRTLEIAQEYARQDVRIRVHNNGEFLRAVQNWNHALQLISAESKYCKVVHADDWLFPECLTEMVKVAEANPTVGLVSSYRLEGSQVRNNGLLYPSTVVPGREICRGSLLNGFYVFGSPTSVLIRSDIVRNRKAFYNEWVPHQDEEVSYAILQDTDFGFVHQVLTYSRVHDETITASFGKRFNTFLLGKLIVLVKYGPIYLTRAEYEQCFNRLMGRYYRFLGNSFIHRREKEFWNYHKSVLEKLGYPLSITRVIKAASLQLIDALFNPKQSIEKVIDKITSQRGGSFGLHC
jgi:glycosyltransferase involved in cell wall biosynthesis